MTSAIIIKELRGTLVLRLFCGRSAFPPPFYRITICYLSVKTRNNRPLVQKSCTKEWYKCSEFLRIYSGILPAAFSITGLQFLPTCAIISGDVKSKSPWAPAYDLRPSSRRNVLHVETCELFQRLEKKRMASAPKTPAPAPAADILASLDSMPVSPDGDTAENHHQHRREQGCH
jgi:hypothetical protein